MTQDSMDIAIVGAGTAGTAAALLLARAGHRITLYERVRQPAPIGAGIVLQPTGQAVLHRLGLLGPVIEHGAQIDRLRCVTGTGRTVFGLDYSPLGPQGFGLGVHRGALFQILLAAANAHPQIDLRCGVDISRPESTRTGLALITATGQRLGPHQLVVVADGARSQLRETCGIPFSESVYDWGALWHVADDPDEVYAGELFQVVRGAHSMLGLLPTGRGPVLDSPPMVSLFFSLRFDELAAFRAGDLDAWKASVLADDPRAAHVLDQLNDPHQLLFARYRHVDMPRWHDDRLVLLGDAAHAMSPQLGQGCNLALVDAAVLADTVSELPLREALAQYTDRRRAHLRYYMWATRWLTPFFQSDLDWLGTLRNVFMPLTTRIPWVRGLMCRSMAGNVRGILRRPLRLSELNGPLRIAAK